MNANDQTPNYGGELPNVVKCPYCQVAHVANTIFCEECGCYLLKDENSETIIKKTGWLGDRKSKPRDTSPLRSRNEPRAIRLRIDTKEGELEVPLNGRAIHLGRTAPASHIFPEVDLTNYIRAKNISRRHARIVKRADAVLVEDLGSLNGTFINGQRLSPYLPEMLSDGDTLQLGDLLIQIKILQIQEEA